MLFLGSCLAYIISTSASYMGVDIKSFNPLRSFLPKDSPPMIDEDRLVDTTLLATTLSMDSLGSEAIREDSLQGKIHQPIIPEDASLNDSLPLLVDYSESQSALSQLRSLLLEAKSQPLYIAFLGDSFIEGDILVGDFRQKLQDKYGGCGVGYVPMTSPVSRFRQTIKHRFGGAWKSATLLHSGRFTLSGMYDHLSGDGFAEYDMIKGIPSLAHIHRALIVYETNSEGMITTTINDSIIETHILEATGSGVLSRLEVNYPQITSIKVEGNGEDINIHGVYLDGDRGVSVDNFSVRGSLGGDLLKVNSGLVNYMKGIRPYQLIVLSYGLNALSTEENGDDYSWYYHKLKKSIQHLKSLYPDALFLILSVSDRATIMEGEVITLPGVYQIRKHQIRLAREEGCLFWDTFSAIKRMGGIETMVQKGWAAKDYTHFSGAGGRKLAELLYHSIVEE